MNIRGKMRARAAARYQVAIAKLKAASDGSYDQDEVAEKMADMVAVDVRVMQLRQAMQDLQILRGDLAGNSLGLDLYALLAYRLPKLQRDVHLRWNALRMSARHSTSHSASAT